MNSELYPDESGTFQETSTENAERAEAAAIRLEWRRNDRSGLELVTILLGPRVPSLLWN